ncbi:MAG: ribosome small subunit-dependent GTPase A [Oscillospiraceae bacterium]
MTGRIWKATAGFYYVKTEEGLVECRARGVFRKEGSTPLVGDMVRLALTEEGKGTVSAILPRKNSLVRPPLANLDRMVLVLAVTDPAPNFFVADSYLAILAHRGIDALVALTKTDLADPSELKRLYAGAGYPVYVVEPDGEGLSALVEALSEGVSAFCGNSGVGKSTLLNRIDSRLALPTADTSRKLGRGRHTTRHVELIPLPGGGLVADTPGFSSIEMLRMGHIPKEELAPCFPEFASYLGKCQFNDCSHTREKGCGVLQALEQGHIDPRRHESYVRLYDEARQVREWEV